MRRGIALAAVAVLAACQPDPPKGPSSEVMRAPACQAGKHRWRTAQPPIDDERIYGVGTGDSEEAAFGLARRRAAECRDEANLLWLFASCFRRSELERELGKAAAKIAKSVPHGGNVLLVPGHDENGWITGLGEKAARVVEGPLAGALDGSGAKLMRLPQWVPADLHEVARKYKISHIVRIEHAAAGRARVRFNLSVLDAADDTALPGSHASFEVKIAPFELELLEQKGPLLPQKDAIGLAANLGAARAKLRLSSSELKEGDKVEIGFTLDADGYAYLFQMEEDGTAAMLIPSPDTPDNHFAAGEHRIPDEKWKANGDVLVACPLPGRAATRENLKLIVAPQPLDLGIAAAGKDMKTLGAGPQGDLASLVKKLNALRSAGVPFADATAPYTVIAVPDSRSGCPK